MDFSYDNYYWLAASLICPPRGLEGEYAKCVSLPRPPIGGLLLFVLSYTVVSGPI